MDWMEAVGDLKAGAANDADSAINVFLVSALHDVAAIVGI